ncbi:hypothetical protein C0993_009594 [Termitomyces sp. T159_Od127]|nr:hypothetical protein C0993_009594 [Termitomyces sp. T159_Od127]
MSRLILIKPPRNARPAQRRVRKGLERSRRQINIALLARLAPIHNRDDNLLIAMLDGGRERDMALRGRVAVEEAVAADVDEGRALDGGDEAARVADCLAAGNVRPADGVTGGAAQGRWGGAARERR